MGEMQGIKKEDLNRIIHLFGERRKSRFGCEDYYTLCGYRRAAKIIIRSADTEERTECSFIMTEHF